MTGKSDIVCTGEALIAADADTVWALIGDLRNMAIMEGLIERLEVEGDGKGAVRKLILSDGGIVAEAIERYDSEARSYGYRILDPGALPFKDYTGAVRVMPISKGVCRLLWEASATPLVDADAVSAAIQGNIDHVLRVVSARFGSGA